MVTAFLIDASGSVSDDVLSNMARVVASRFRPGDVVFLFDVRSYRVSFVGNPTIQDILVERMKRFPGGTDPVAAFIEARKVAPCCKIVVLSDGEYTDPCIEYELVKFTTY